MQCTETNFPQPIYRFLNVYCSCKEPGFFVYIVRKRTPHPRKHNLSFHSLTVSQTLGPLNPTELLSVSLSLCVSVSLCLVSASCQGRTGRRTSGRTSAVTQTTRPEAPGASPWTPWSACRPVAFRSAQRVSRAGLPSTSYSLPNSSGLCASLCPPHVYRGPLWVMHRLLF